MPCHSVSRRSCCSRRKAHAPTSHPCSKSLASVRPPVMPSHSLAQHHGCCQPPVGARGSYSAFGRPRTHRIDVGGCQGATLRALGQNGSRIPHLRRQLRKDTTVIRERATRSSNEFAVPSERIVRLPDPMVFARPDTSTATQIESQTHVLLDTSMTSPVGIGHLPREPTCRFRAEMSLWRRIRGICPGLSGRDSTEDGKFLHTDICRHAPQGISQRARVAPARANCLAGSHRPRSIGSFVFVARTGLTCPWRGACVCGSSVKRIGVDADEAGRGQPAGDGFAHRVCVSVFIE